MGSVFNCASMVEMNNVQRGRKTYRDRGQEEGDDEKFHRTKKKNASIFSYRMVPYTGNVNIMVNEDEKHQVPPK